MCTWLKKFYQHFSLFEEVEAINRSNCISCCVKGSFDDPNFESHFFNPVMISLVGRVILEFNGCYSGLSVEESKDIITFRVW